MTNSNYPSAGYPGNVPPPTPTPPKNSNNSKNIIIGLLAAGLIGTWGYFLWDKNKATEKLQQTQTQSTAYMTQRDSLSILFNEAEIKLDSITGVNNTLQNENSLAKSELQKEIDAKKAEIRRILSKTNATEGELKKAKSLISELNRKIDGLAQEVTKLQGENKVLTENNTRLTGEKQELEQNLQTSNTEKEALTKTVDVGSTFSASNIQITPINEKKNGKEKESTTARKVDKLVVSFDVENRIAKSGTADMYVIVTGPDGKVINDGSGGNLSSREDGERAYSTKTSLDYEQGTHKTVSVPIRQSDFSKGDYKIEIYHNGFKIGSGVRTLKKGGLFG